MRRTKEEKKIKPVLGWAVEHHHTNLLDGDRRYLEGCPDLGYARTFRTRKSARKYIEDRHGYIRRRPDLQAEPFGWRVPQAVRVSVLITPITRRSK